MAVDAASIPKTVDTPALYRFSKERRWVMWRYEQRDPSKKPTKVPYDVNGSHASSTDPATWSTYDECLQAAGGYDGIGIVLGNGLAGVDLDHCRSITTGEIYPWALEILNELTSYSELSPSAEGIHVLIEGELPGPGLKRFINPATEEAIEIYSSGRYFTWTGRHLPGSPGTVIEKQDALERLYRRVRKMGKDQKGPRARSDREMRTDDSALLARIYASSQGPKFRDLWSGGLAELGSASEADLSLCSILAWWLQGDPKRIDELFRQSARYRKKWEREDYRMATIEKAIAFCGGRFYRRAMAEEADAEPAEAPQPLLVIGNPAARPECPPIDWLVDGILLSGATTALIGPPKKAKKTLFALQLAFALESGMPFLGRAVKKSRVGVVQHDNPRGIFLNYVDQIQYGSGFPVVNIPYRDGMSHPCFDLAKPPGQKSLVAWIERTGIEVLVLDSLSGLCPHINRKNDEENSPFYRGFLNPVLRDKLGLSVILLTHVTKVGGDTLIGGVDQTAAVDSKLSFAPSDSGILTVSGEGRHADFKLILRLEALPPPQLGLRLIETSAVPPERQDEEELAMAFLGGRGEVWSSTTAAAEGIGRSRDRTKTIFARLLQKGEIETRRGSTTEHGGRPGQEWRMLGFGQGGSE